MKQTAPESLQVEKDVRNQAASIDWEKDFFDKFEYIEQCINFYTNSMYAENKKPGKEHLQDIVGFIRSLLLSTTHQYYQKIKEIIKALQKIDAIVCNNAGFEADCYLGLNEPRGENPNPEVAKEWAETIMEVYKITHPLLHECCGGKKASDLLQLLEEK